MGRKQWHGTGLPVGKYGHWPRIAGYYTLSAFSIVGDKLPEALQKKLPKYGQVPCTLLGRLAVDRDYRALGLGKHLLIDALKRASVHAFQTGQGFAITSHLPLQSVADSQLMQVY